MPAERDLILISEKSTRGISLVGHRSFRNPVIYGSKLLRLYLTAFSLRTLAGSDEMDCPDIRTARTDHANCSRCLTSASLSLRFTILPPWTPPGPVHHTHCWGHSHGDGGPAPTDVGLSASTWSLVRGTDSPPL